MTAATITHAPIVRTWDQTPTEPAEVSVRCTCGRFGFDSQETVSGGVEPWGDLFADHVAEMENGDPES